MGGCGGAVFARCLTYALKRADEFDWPRSRLEE